MWAVTTGRCGLIWWFHGEGHAEKGMDSRRALEEAKRRGGKVGTRNAQGSHSERRFPKPKVSMCG